MRPPAVLAALQERLPEMTACLRALVSVESPSNDVEATARCAGLLQQQAEELWSATPQRVERGGRTHLCWSFGDRTRVLLLGHLDTVWALGTLDRWPFSSEDGRATGPGCFDMKAGLVQGLFALTMLDDPTGVTVLVTADEEIGSPTSRGLVEELATGAEAVLVLEPSADGALKVARKGISRYEVAVAGRAAHAGLEPERGANAAVELAEQALRVEALAHPGAGTTVTPTTMAAGSSANTVPASARMDVDVRVTSVEEQARVDAAMHGLTARRPGTTVGVTGGPNRPPMTAESAQDLLARAQNAAQALGLPSVDGVGVGGASDGNFTAAAGVPTLDGLGAVGHGAHAEGESVELGEMPARAALLAVLLSGLLEDPP